MTLPKTPLREWRDSPAGFPLCELARRIGKSRRTVLRVAAGRAPSPETARAIRRETGISLDRLIGDAIPPEPQPRATPRARGPRGGIFI